MASNFPRDEIRKGTLKATIWENETQNGMRYNVTFRRLYKAEDGWKTSDSFGRDDLLLLSKLADSAHTRIYEQSKGEE